jgi:hypothetical protein
MTQVQSHTWTVARRALRTHMFGYTAASICQVNDAPCHLTALDNIQNVK